ncbi:CHASE2 domain-containing protein [Falsiroseomonas sp.]|uniref:CHASE2 domain-containing protein n=1 Tax=Falsiroseomonas sp. TaxID=2870721 RepID=UPI003F713EE7
MIFDRSKPTPGHLPHASLSWCDWRRARSDEIRAKVVKLLVILVIILADPFGLQAAAVDGGRRIADRLASVNYEARHAADIRVVLVQDADVGVQGWPPSFEDWAIQLENVLSAEPAAILLDIAFMTPRGPAERLEAVLRNSRVPIVLVDSGRQAVVQPRDHACPAPAEARPGLVATPMGQPDAQALPWAGRERRAQSSLVNFAACAATAIGFYDWPVPGDRRTYSLAIRHEPTGYDPRGAVAVAGHAPAVIVADIACRIRKRGDPRRPDWCDDAAWLRQPYPALAPLIPIWPIAASNWPTGQRLPPDAADPVNPLCRPIEANGARDRLHLYWRVILNELIGHPTTSLFGRAPIHLDNRSAVPSTPDEEERVDRPSLPAAPCPQPAFVAGVMGGGALDDAQQAALRGSYVIIGDGRTGTSDRVRTPLHGSLPGAFLQAVALENLLTLGPAYQRADTKIGPVERGKLLDWAIKAALIGLAFFLAWRRDALCAHCLPRGAGRGFLGWLGGWSGGWAQVTLLFVLGTFVVTLLVAMRLAAGWIGFLVLCPIALWIATVALDQRLGLQASAAAAPPPAEEAARIRRGLTWLFRLTTLLACVALIAAADAIGKPSASPLLVMLVGIAILFPILDHSPLDDHHPEATGGGAH